MAETPTGLVNGSNTVFTAAGALLPNHILFADRAAQTPGLDYSYVGANITFLAAAFPESTVPGAPPAGTRLTLYNGASLPGRQGGAQDNGPGGSRSLAALRLLIRQESDTENDPHIGDPELTSWINQSLYRLYDKLITSFGDDYYTAKATIITDGSNTEYPLPDGILYGGAPAFYKGQLVEAIGGGNVAPNAPVTLHQFNMREKNRYMRPLSILAAPNMFPRYRILGSNPGSLVFTPLPSSGLQVRMWYAPKLAPLVADTDVADDFSGWLEMVVVDCVIKVLGKQERDAGLFAARKAELVAEINAATANRNLAEPNTVTMTEGEGFGPFGGVPGGGAWGGGFW